MVRRMVFLSEPIHDPWFFSCVCVSVCVMATFSSCRGGLVRVHHLFYDSWMVSHGPLVPAPLCGAWFPYHSNPIRPSSSLFPRIHGIHPRPQQQQQQQHEDEDDSDDESVSRRRAAGRGAHARGLPRGRGDVTRGLQSEGRHTSRVAKANKPSERAVSRMDWTQTHTLHPCLWRGMEETRTKWWSG